MKLHLQGGRLEYELDDLQDLHSFEELEEKLTNLGQITSVSFLGAGLNTDSLQTYPDYTPCGWQQVFEGPTQDLRIVALLSRISDQQVFHLPILNGALLDEGVRAIATTPEGVPYLIIETKLGTFYVGGKVSEVEVNN